MNIRYRMRLQLSVEGTGILVLCGALFSLHSRTSPAANESALPKAVDLSPEALANVKLQFDVRVKPTGIQQVMKRLFAICAFAIVLTGCATQSQSRHPTGNRQTSHGTVVDYDGVPCRNQNMHVKSPICLFPRTLTSLN
ncbi:putative periplasmic lipoprotein [Paraburkholderia strydomiana]|uniref:hypothetical protein n=1 Tax=Paraburkholderia strydomiana TaxID=1245417 RepID=UPI0038BC36C0